MISTRLHGSSIIKPSFNRRLINNTLGLKPRRLKHKRHNGTKRGRVIFTLPHDSVLYDEMSYLIPILNSIEEEAEFAEERNQSNFISLGRSVYETVGQTAVGRY